MHFTKVLVDIGKSYTIYRDIDLQCITAEILRLNDVHYKKFSNGLIGTITKTVDTTGFIGYIFSQNRL